MFVSTKGQRGTGLGLPVSQKIMQEHGGDIRVESTPGVGSRFILEFPTATAEPRDQGRETSTGSDITRDFEMR
jgi:signal transduction histidine kinase